MIFLRRTDPTKNIDRFYVVSLIPHLIGRVDAVARVGPPGIAGHCAPPKFCERG